MLRPESIKTSTTTTAGGKVSKYLLAQQHKFQVFELREEGSFVRHEFNRNELLELAKQDANIVYPNEEGTQPTARSRDVRLLNPEFHSNNSIVVRMLCVICSLDPIHALVLPDRLFVIVPPGADAFLMRMKLKMKELCEDHGTKRSMDLLRLSSRRARQPSVTTTSSSRRSLGTNGNRIDLPQTTMDDLKREALLLAAAENGGEDEQEPDAKPRRHALGLVTSSESTVEEDHHRHIHHSPSAATTTLLDRLPSLVIPHLPHRHSRQREEEEEEIEELEDGNELVHTVPAPDSDIVMAAAAGLREVSNSSGFPGFDEEHDSLSFELRALESILFACVEMIAEEVAKVKPRVIEIETSVDADVNTVRLENIRRTKHAIDSVLARATGISNAVNDTLLDDRGMALMSFSRILAEPDVYAARNDQNEAEWAQEHVEVEMLLESYLQMIDALIAEAQVARRGLESAESNFLLRLDNARNKLLTVRVSIYTVTSVCSFGTFFTALFAMNLNSGIQTAPYWFWSITGVVCVGSIVFIMAFLSFIARRGYLLV